MKLNYRSILLESILLEWESRNLNKKPDDANLTQSRRNTRKHHAGGHQARSHTVLRIHNAGYHVVLFVRQARRDWTDLREEQPLAARGRRIRWQLVHLPGVPVHNEGNQRKSNFDLPTFDAPEDFQGKSSLSNKSFDMTCSVLPGVTRVEHNCLHQLPSIGLDNLNFVPTIAILRRIAQSICCRFSLQKFRTFDRHACRAKIVLLN